MLLDCKCGATCRIPSQPKARVRCGACKYEFTPRDLVKARHEPPPAAPPLDLSRQLDIEDEEMVNDGKCPECTGKLRDDGYCPKCGEFWELDD